MVDTRQTQPLLIEESADNTTGKWTNGLNRNFILSVPFPNIAHAAYQPDFPPYNAKFDGITDDTTAIQNCENDASAAGGGLILFPAGTTLVSNLVKKSNTYWKGQGSSATAIKQKAGQTTDVITGDQFASLTGGSTSGGPANWGIFGLTVDGNDSVNTTNGWGIRFYGYAFTIKDIVVKNCHGGGIWTEYNFGLGVDITTAAQGEDIEIFDNGGTGLSINGPTDTRWFNLLTHGNANGCEIFVAPSNSGGQLFVDCHTYANKTFNTSTSYGWQILGSGCNLIGCIGEGSWAGQFLIKGSGNILNGCHAFWGGVGESAAGFQIGIAGLGGSANILKGCIASQCAVGVAMTASDGFNIIQVICQQAGGVLFNGALGLGDEMDVKSDGTISYDGTYQTGGTFAIWRHSPSAFSIGDTADGSYQVNYNTVTKVLELLRSTKIRMYSDFYGDNTVTIDSSNAQISGVIVARQSTQVISGNGQTITTGEIGSVILTSSTGANLTGMILAVGTAGGQTFTIVNTTAFTITFAASGTSHVFGAPTQDAGVAQDYMWDGTNSLWRQKA